MPEAVTVDAIRMPEAVTVDAIRTSVGRAVNGSLRDIRDGTNGSGYNVYISMGTVPPLMVADILEKVPMHRMGQPEEMARVVSFLAQDASGYITGQIWASTAEYM